MCDISFAMCMFSCQTSRTAQWVHLFLMNFTDFRSLFLCFSLKCPFPMNKSLLNGNPIYMRLISIRSSIRIKLFYSDDNFVGFSLYSNITDACENKPCKEAAVPRQCRDANEGVCRCRLPYRLTTTGFCVGRYA